MFTNTDKEIYYTEKVTEQEWIEIASETNGNKRIAKAIESYLNMQIEKIPQPASAGQIKEILMRKFEELAYPNKDIILSVEILGYPIISGIVKNPIDNSEISF